MAELHPDPEDVRQAREILQRLAIAHGCRCHDNPDMYEWGSEIFSFGTQDPEVRNARRVSHYEKLTTITTVPGSVKEYTGQDISILNHIVANDRVLSYLRACVDTYFIGCPTSHTRCPISPKLIVVIALNYLHNGGRQSAKLFQIPRLSYLIDEGFKALCKLDNIKLPNTESMWITSTLGFDQMFGLPNVAASLHVSRVYGVPERKEYLCPDTKRHCLKVATVTDSSGKYLDYYIFNGSTTETNLLKEWPFYHRMKATEAVVGLGGSTAEPVGGRVSDQPSQCETTSVGILVDKSFAGVDCALFMPPDASKPNSVYNQLHSKTRLHHDREYGISSLFDKVKPLPGDVAHHQIRAAMHLMNVRASALNNPEHTCHK